MRRSTTVWVLGLLIVASASAQPGPREKWITATSGPFTVYSNAKPAKTRDILLALEQLRTVISAMSPSSPQSERPTVLYAFASRDSVSKYFSVPPRPDVVHMSEYLVAPDATHIVLNAAETPSKVLPWVYRAYLGQELMRRFPDLPLWARSGLAHFYATLQVDKKGTVRIGRPDKHHLEMLRTMNWIPLRQLFGLNRDSGIMNSGRSRQIFEAQTWLLTHYLMTAKGAERPASQLFAALDSGLTPEEGIRQVFGLGIEDFERNLSAYVRGATMSYFSVTIDDLPAGDYEVEPIGPTEMSLRLGRHLVLALSPPPVEAAERHLEPLVGDPHLGGDALATLADLRHKSGRLGEARALYERAASAQPQLAVSHLNHAKFLAETEGAIDARRRLLVGALEIDPDLGEAWAELARAHQLEDGTEYAAHLQRALELMPERADLAYNLAMSHLRSGDSAAARQVVALRLRNPDNRELANDAEREIARYETVAASNQALRAGDLGSAIERLRAALSAAQDPVVREQIQGELERLERQARHSARVDAFNSAVGQVNEGRTREAEEGLRELLPQVEDEALRASIEDLLARLEGNH